MLRLQRNDYLSKNFQYCEAYVSREYPNHTSDLRNYAGGWNELIYIQANDVLQPMRDHLNKPIIVENWFRDEWLNDKVGGWEHSLHLIGLATDVKTEKLTDLFILYKFCKEQLRDILCEIILYTDEHGNPKFLHVARKMYGKKEIVKKTIYKPTR